MNNKQKYIGLLSLFFILISVSTVFATGLGNSRTLPIGDTLLKFRPSHPANVGYDYGDHIFTKNFYQGQYAVYMPIKSGDSNIHYLMRRFLIENTQTSLGRNGDYLYGNTWFGMQAGITDLNLKKGQSTPGTRTYNGDNTGTFYLGYLEPYKSSGIKNVEYRYLGYVKDGTVINNPYFPLDKPASANPQNNRWLKFGTPTRHTSTDFNERADIAQATFEKWFVATDDGAKFKQKAIDLGYAGQEWKYWNDYFTILTDINESAGIIRGWFTRSNGTAGYMSFTIPDPPTTNMTVTGFELIDPETGEVLVKRTRTYTDPFDVQSMVENPYDENIVLNKGKTYKLRATFDYNAVKENSGDADRQTITSPTEADAHYAYDANANKYNVFDKELKQADGNGIVSNNKPTTMLPGEQAVFEWDYVVDQSASSQILLYVKVPPIFLENGDNDVKDDDFLQIEAKLGQNDIGFTTPVELYNSQGQKVQYVYPQEMHSVKFNVKHFLGQTVIGLDPTTNPKTTIDVDIRDGSNNILRKTTIQASQLLNPTETIAIEVNNIFPQKTVIKACATINKVHADNGLNSNPGNDTICAVFAEAKNYAVKDLKISPHYIYVPDGETRTEQTLHFQFIVAHEGRSSFGHIPIIEVKQGGNLIYRASHPVPAGEEVPISLAIPVNLRFGENNFSVEVNPEPRMIEEFRSTGLDPYEDNIKTDSVIVKRNPECISCTVGVRTRNTWSEIFKMHEHHAHRETYIACSPNGDGTVSCSPRTRCVLDYHFDYTEVVDFYETYKIEHVYFRSKWSKDTRGGDGWVDLLTSEGKIKSGYGFELKIVTRYKTNRGSIPPVPSTWRNDCSYLSRNPGIGYVTNPDMVSLEMPYKDGFGNNVCYILNSENPSGSWSNNSKEFQLPVDFIFIDTIPYRCVYSFDNAFFDFSI